MQRPRLVLRLSWGRAAISGLPVHDGPVREPWPRLQPRGHYIAALSIDALKIHPTEKTDGAADLVGESMSKLKAFFICLFVFSFFGVDGGLSSVWLGLELSVRRPSWSGPSCSGAVTGIIEQLLRDILPLVFACYGKLRVPEWAPVCGNPAFSETDEHLFHFFFKSHFLFEFLFVCKDHRLCSRSAGSTAQLNTKHQQLINTIVFFLPICLLVNFRYFIFIFLIRLKTEHKWVIRAWLNHSEVDMTCLDSVLWGDNPRRGVLFIYLFIPFPCRVKPGGLSLAIRLCLETTGTRLWTDQVDSTPSVQPERRCLYYEQTNQHARWVKWSTAMGGASLTQQVTKHHTSCWCLLAFKEKSSPSTAIKPFIVVGTILLRY